MSEKIIFNETEAIKKGYKITHYALVVVKWKDAYSDSDVKIEETQPNLITRIDYGILIKATKDTITLARGFCFEGDEWTHTLTIPKSEIELIRRVSDQESFWLGDK